jgi:UDP-glucose:(heptosyl)LPS alpha-1,3-glucosyltransferase
MKLALFIHDFFLEIGHGRAIIEKIRAYPRLEEIDLEVYCFTSDSIEVLIPGLKKSKIRVFPFLKHPRPFLIKSILFQFYSLFVHAFFIERDRKVISVGIASLRADLIEIPFLHEHYQKFYLEHFAKGKVERIYKKLMYSYDGMMEKIVYQNPNIRLFSVSKFMSAYMEKNICPGKRVTTIYHGINTEHFEWKDTSRKDSLDVLISDYPQLSRLNLDKEIFLFIGALERKGVYEALSRLEKESQFQIIIIGIGEKALEFQSKNIIIHIPHTKNVQGFYQLADSFIFPTLYEPFGLVLLEAAAMGLRIYSNKECVGAFDIISSLPQVYALDTSERISFTGLPISREDKARNVKLCKEILKNYNWERASSEFFKLLSAP